MSVGGKIIKNFFSLVVGNVISKFLTFLGFVVIARVLGPDIFGKINFVQAISLYFLILTHLGLSLLGTREIAHNKTMVTKYVNEIFTLRLLLAMISFVVLIAFAYIIKFPFETRILIILFGLSLLPMALYLDWAFKGLESMEFIGLCEALKAIILYALLIFIIKSPKDIYKTPILFFISAIIGTLLLFIIYYVKYDKFKLVLSAESAKNLVKTALPLGISFIMIQIYYQMGTIILGFTRGDASVAWYNAAFKIVLFLIAFAGFFIDSIFPIISRYYKYSLENLKNFSNFTTKLTTSFAIPIGVAGTILAPQLINIFYGSEYNKCISPFRILLWTSVVILVSMNFGNSLIACNCEKKYLFGVCIGASTNIILNLILIHFLDYNGASIAMLITETVVFIYMLYHYTKIVRVFLERYFIKPVIASIVMGFITYVLREKFIIATLGAIVSYCLTFWVIKGFNRADFLFLKHYLNAKE